MASIFLLNATNDEMLQLRFLCFVSPCQKPAVDYLKGGGCIEQLELFHGLLVVSCLRLGLLKVQRQQNIQNSLPISFSNSFHLNSKSASFSTFFFSVLLKAKPLCCYNLLVSILFHVSKLKSYPEGFFLNFRSLWLPSLLHHSHNLFSNLCNLVILIVLLFVLIYVINVP